MFFRNEASGDSWKKYSMGSYPNLIIYNVDLANFLEFSTNGESTSGIVPPDKGIAFDNAFISEIWIRSYVPGSSASFYLWTFGKSIEQQFSTSQAKENVVPDDVSLDFPDRGIPFNDQRGVS